MSGVRPFFIGPILGAISLSCAPSFWTARCSVATALASLESVTRTARVRPLMVLGALATRLSAGDGSRSSRGWTAGAILSALPTKFMPAATRLPRSGSIRLRWPSMRVRTAMVSTLLSSKASAPTMLACSGAVIER